MATSILSAELRRYNANTRGTRTGDCVKRALSLALDMSYNDIGKALNEQMKKIRTGQWNIRPVFEPVMLRLGCTPFSEEGLGDVAMTLEEFVDNIADPAKTYVILTSSKPQGRESHLVCVREGEIWDSWDSRKEYVCEYSVAPTSARAINRDEVDYEGLLQIAEALCVDSATAYMKKRGWDYISMDAETIKASNFRILITNGLSLRPNDWVDKKRYYSFEINVTFEPTMSESDMLAYLKKTIKTRMYDRMYAIEQQENQLKEEYEVRQQLNYNPKNPTMSRKDRKFYNSLPGWVKPLVTYLNITNPGQYHDSYELYIMPLPSDTSMPKGKEILFEAYDAAQLKDMLRRYKENGEVPGRDYYPTEDVY